MKPEEKKHFDELTREKQLQVLKKIKQKDAEDKYIEQVYAKLPKEKK